MRPHWIVLMVVCARLAGAVAGDFATGLAAYEKRDFVTALKEWKPLAEEGNPDAQYNLGLMSFEGQGVPESFAGAAEWFEKAAEQGHTKAQRNLGALYGIGKGVKKDFVQSWVWLALCAATGDQKCISQRDLVAQKLNASKLATAQRMAREWKPKPAAPIEK